MWERTLQDLIRGLRANKKDEAKFIAKAVDEIRQEIKSEDMELKAGAVLKLTYLDMLGYDMSWASFHVVEVMSSPKAHLKSVGYLGAIQSFTEETDVLMLTTNLLKKDLSSTPADVAITLNGLAHIVTPDLARDLAPELIAMLNHSRPHIRKRAILAVYKLVMKYPEAAPQIRTRLEEKLDDSDPSVVAATVNVICELARKSPQDYLSLAPRLFHLLTTSSNNWMLIKIIKLFGSLCPFEPRLVKKLQSPITELISTTPAISLLYECVHTCIISGMLQGHNGASLAKTCVSKLAAFIEDSDQNLKYIALLAMTKIVPTHAYLVAEYRDTILASVSDQDISIRMRALDLVSAMVDRSNLQTIVQQLLTHLLPEANSELPSAVRSLQNSTEYSQNKPAGAATLSPAYRLTLTQRILEMCSASMYENVTNFEWYISVLVDLVYISNVKIGAQVRDQLVEIASRVRAVRPYAVKVLYTLLTDESLLQNAHDERSCPEVLWAAAWICGEYSSELLEPQKLIPYLLQTEVSNLPADIVAVYVQAAVKVFGSWAAEIGQQWDDGNLPEVQQVVATVISRMNELVSSPHVEIQERASNALELFTFISADLKNWKHQTGPSTTSGVDLDSPSFPKSLYLIQPLFSTYELNPVAVSAQASVPVPAGLDLDEWIVPPPREPVVEEQEILEKKVKKGKKGKEKQLNGGKKSDKTKKQTDSGSNSIGDTLTPVYDETETPEDAEERERRKAERLAQQKDDPYYIMDTRPKPHDVDSIPVAVVRLDDIPPPSPSMSDNRLTSLRVAQSSYAQHFIIDRDGEMPQGARASDAVTPPQKPSAPESRTASPYPVISSFPQYEVLENSTPEPIKVVRAKKGTGKKKRTKTSSTNDHIS
ncbi:Ap3d1 protein [Coprinopsis marcescibilis]|uniref:AP-3 complex subunit delta n=1 Tax=Coprinopsis marcescibilis TaxID=230819 RepID=A0A5C3L1P7_COPMA|nr:Ap3d1 protein [Coprinopsis marcescibilis]